MNGMKWGDVTRCWVKLLKINLEEGCSWWGQGICDTGFQSVGTPTFN